MGQRVHVVPPNDLVAHDTETDDCLCGPRVEYVPSATGNGWLFVHQSLDRREVRT